MHIVVDKQLDSMLRHFNDDLRAAKAIDKNNTVTDEKKFTKIVEGKINECERLLSFVERDGVVFDVYGFDLICARVQNLRDMIATKSMSPYTIKIDDIEETIKNQKPNIIQQIHTAISKSFQRDR